MPACVRIIPQAICTRFGLAIGYYFSPLVLLLMGLFFPISFPIAILLDKILGKDHNTFFRRAGEGEGGAGYRMGGGADTLYLH